MNLRLRDLDEDVATAIDPNCGMTVSVDTPRRVEHQGRTYYFCSDGCQQRFEEQPEVVLEKARQRDIRQGRRDPVCGMRTDPEHPAHVAEHEGCDYHFCSAGCRERSWRIRRVTWASRRHRHSRLRQRLRAPCTPARCIRKFASKARASAPNAAWRWSRRCRRQARTTVAKSVR